MAKEINYKKPGIIVFLITLHLFLGAGALAGGLVLMADPSGKKLGTPLDLVTVIGLKSFLIPAIVLFVFLGLLPNLIAYSLNKKPKWGFFEKNNPVKKLHWSWTGSFFVSVFLLCWTSGEIILWGFNPLSIIYFIIGLILLLSSLSGKTVAYYKNN